MQMWTVFAKWSALSKENCGRNSNVGHSEKAARDSFQKRFATKLTFVISTFFEFNFIFLTRNIALKNSRINHFQLLYKPQTQQKQICRQSVRTFCSWVSRSEQPWTWPLGQHVRLGQISSWRCWYSFLLWSSIARWETTEYCWQPHSAPSHSVPLRIRQRKWLSLLMLLPLVEHLRVKIPKSFRKSSIKSRFNI